MTVAGVLGRQRLFLVRIHRALGTGLMEMPNRSGRWMPGGLGYAFPCMDHRGSQDAETISIQRKGSLALNRKGRKCPGDIPAARPPGADRSQVNASVQLSIY